MNAITQFAKRPALAFKIAATIASAVFYGTAGYIYFERPDKPELEWLDGLWWAVVTMTTVGYGDYFPTTTGGRFVIAYPLMLLGMGFMAYGLAQLAAFFLEADSLNRKGKMMVDATAQLLICNYPSNQRFEDVLSEIRNQPQLARAPVVLIDETLEELPAELSHHDVSYVKGHPARLETLERANVTAAEYALVLAREPSDSRSDDATIAVCLMLKHCNPNLHVVAECVDAANAEVMRRSGCDSIVCVMGLAPGILAQELHDPGVVSVLEELTKWDEDINNIFIVPLALNGNKTVADLRAWSDTEGVTLLGVRKENRIRLNPARDLALGGDDAAVIMTLQRPVEIRL